MPAWRGPTQSAVLSVAHAGEERVELPAVGERPPVAVGGPGHEHVELDLSQEGQRLDVGLAVAVAEDGGAPAAVGHEHRVAGEEEALLAVVPPERGRAGRV